VILSYRYISYIGHVLNIETSQSFSKHYKYCNEISCAASILTFRYNLDLAAKLVTSNTGAEKNEDNLRDDLTDPAWQKVSSPLRKKPNQNNTVIQIDDDDGVYQNMSTDNMSYQDLRAEAELFAQQRRECLQKAAEAYQAKNAGTSQYYADQVCCIQYTGCINKLQTDISALFINSKSNMALHDCNLEHTFWKVLVIREIRRSILNFERTVLLLVRISPRQRY